MTKQKFHHGDLVHIKAELPACMSHFQKDQDAVVMGSYTELCLLDFDSDDCDSYTVLLVGDGNEVSWYHDDNLVFIRKVSESFIKKIKRDAENRRKEKDETGKLARFFIRCCIPEIGSGTGIWWQGFKTKKEAEENAKKCKELGYLDVTVEHRYMGSAMQALEFVED
jgi:hypothetical protein